MHTRSRYTTVTQPLRRTPGASGGGEEDRGTATDRAGGGVGRRFESNRRQVDKIPVLAADQEGGLDLM